VRAFWCVRVYQFQPKTAEVEPANCGKQKRPLALHNAVYALQTLHNADRQLLFGSNRYSIEMRSFVASELVFLADAPKDMLRQEAEETL
jgi:hypothetical protein